MIVLAAGCVIAGAWALLLLNVEPVPTWFYVFAWYPTLVILDRVGTRTGDRPLLAEPRRATSLLAWSAVIWLVFEAANFRLLNWYYVSLPRNAAERWAGILLSFATVVPALILAARALGRIGVGLRWRTRPVGVRELDLRGAQLLGLALAVLALGWPGIFFPLVWGAVWLLADPWVYRRRPDWSLFGDLERGEWGRIGRLALAGLGVGVLWESYNFWARGKWIYTVPWLEHTKWFEMPPLGFLGFPLFALEAWALYHALCAAGVAVPPTGRPTLRRRQLLWAAPLALGFVVAVLTGMERRTISSVVPSPQEIAAASPGQVQLIGLRGIGAQHAERLADVGVASVCGLAARVPATLHDALHAAREEQPLADWRVRFGAVRPTLAEVGVWVGAARRECDERELEDVQREPGNGKRES
ncbi:MAG: DUF4332 domain-containing protein [Gemmatimonadales bacterium]|jgi:hypothetical protein